MLAYGSGLRIGEIVNLRVEDIDSKKYENICTRRKRKQRKIYNIIKSEFTNVENILGEI